MKQQLPLDEWKRRKTWQAEMDMERITFLEKLDDSELLLTDWEQEFVGNFMQAGSEGREQNWFTEGRRKSTDKMRMKYGDCAEIKMPFPGTGNLQAAVDRIPAADAGCCMYIVQDEGRRQRPCNEPATCRTRSGFRYCDAHRDIAVEACKRKKIGFTTVPVQP